MEFQTNYFVDTFGTPEGLYHPFALFWDSQAAKL